MFGLVQPCRHILSPQLHRAWVAHLCGSCLTLRDRHGQVCRAVTSQDAALVSVLVAAQRPEAALTRDAGPCVLRGLRPATVLRSDTPAAGLAAGVSLLLAGGKYKDHLVDRDLPRPAHAVAGLMSRRWEAAGKADLARLGMDAAALTEVVERQLNAERDAGPADLLRVTAPTEDAVAAAFAHTATLAGRSHNAEPLAQVGRSFGRVAHLVDALVDLDDDSRNGRWNPLLATRTDRATALGLIGDALGRIRDALAHTDIGIGSSLQATGLDDPGACDDLPPHHLQRRLAHQMLVHVLPRSVYRTAACAVGGAGACSAGGTKAAGGTEASKSHRRSRRKRCLDDCDCPDCCDCCECCNCCGGCDC